MSHPARTGGGGASARWLPRRTADGSWTLVHAGHGEACHADLGAWSEAWERYAVPCRLRERARSGTVRESPRTSRGLPVHRGRGIAVAAPPSTAANTHRRGALLPRLREPLEARGGFPHGLSGELARVRLLDVGTGLGWNLAAALAALEGTGAALDAVTLERDPGVLAATLALGAAGAFRDAPGERFHRRVRATLARALARPGEAVPWGKGGRRGTLRLLVGEAVDTAGEAARPGTDPGFDAVFLDLFSPRVDPDAWDERLLAALAARMRPGSWLSTYSAAFPVRLGLARAGLRVGQGPRVGRKAEGTLASPDREPPPLSPRVARRLAREEGVFGGPPGEHRGGID